MEPVWTADTPASQTAEGSRDWTHLVVKQKPLQEVGPLITFLHGDIHHYSITLGKEPSGFLQLQ